MSIVQDIVSEIGLPTGAVALAFGLVRGAKYLEKDASDRALKLFSDLITKGDLKNIGKAGAGLVPLVFDRVFGSRPTSFRFICRSILATTLFWLILLSIRHANWTSQIFDDLTKYLVILTPIFYVIDWVSLLKARLLISIVSERNAITTSLLFLALDAILSYGVAVLFMGILIFVANATGLFPVDYYLDAKGVLSFKIISNYFTLPSGDIGITNVTVPSTMLTSVWTFLLFISCIVAQLLVPIDYLRRFTTFWFKNVEKQPLTAIAKVAATLIIVGAMVLKVVRWIF